MLRARDNDDDIAFGELIRRHQGPLMNFFLRSGVYGDVEDLAQETFLRLHRYRKRYEPRAKFTTFLYLLARQVRIDSLRRSKRRHELRTRYEKEVDKDIRPLPTERGERLDLEAALARLSEAMREVVVLCVMQGFSQSEAAEIMDIPIGTVKSRLFNALNNLRQDLRGTNDETGNAE